WPVVCDVAPVVVLIRSRPGSTLFPYTTLFRSGWIPVTIPGAPGAWAKLSKKFGNLPLTEVLKPAITYAKEGYPLSPTLGKYWKRDRKSTRLNSSHVSTSYAVFCWKKNKWTPSA